MTDYDIVIVGSGVVGASAALALSKYSHLKIGILEASEVSLECKLENYDARVSAISLASKKFFQDLNVWDEICNKRISSYKNMYVWDGVGKSDIQFNCADMQELSLGYIIEDSVMRLY
jgi:2-octaprenylphenol hydroxylase